MPSKTPFIYTSSGGPPEVIPDDLLGETRREIAKKTRGKVLGTVYIPMPIWCDRGIISLANISPPRHRPLKSARFSTVCMPRAFISTVDKGKHGTSSGGYSRFTSCSCRDCPPPLSRGPFISTVDKSKHGTTSGGCAAFLLNINGVLAGCITAEAFWKCIWFIILHCNAIKQIMNY